MRLVSFAPFVVALLTGCASIPKNIPPTCPDAAHHAERARGYQRHGAAGLAVGIPLALGAGALGGAAIWSSVEASTVNPTFVIIQPDGQRVNSAGYYADLSTGLSIANGVTGGFAVGLNVAGGVNLGLRRLETALMERDLDRCSDRDYASEAADLVQQVLEGGAWVVLESGIAHRIDPDSVATAARWQRGEPILVRGSLLFNEARAEGVKTVALGRALEPSIDP